MYSAKDIALKDIDKHLKETYGKDFRKYSIYSKYLDTKENIELNRKIRVLKSSALFFVFYLD